LLLKHNKSLDRFKRGSEKEEEEKWETWFGVARTRAASDDDDLRYLRDEVIAFMRFIVKALCLFRRWNCCATQRLCFLKGLRLNDGFCFVGIWI